MQKCKAWSHLDFEYGRDQVGSCRFAHNFPSLYINKNYIICNVYLYLCMFIRVSSRPAQQFTLRIWCGFAFVIGTLLLLLFEGS